MGYDQEMYRTTVRILETDERAFLYLAVSIPLACGRLQLARRVAQENLSRERSGRIRTRKAGYELTEASHGPRPRLTFPRLLLRSFASSYGNMQVWEVLFYLAVLTGQGHR